MAKEKLSAFVSENEQPYEVPGNWVWTRVNNLVDLHRGVSFTKDAVRSEKSDNDCLIMRGGNIEEGGINFDDNIYVHNSLVSQNQYVKKHDVIIVSSTGSTKVIGKAGISDDDYDDIAFGAFLTLVRPRESFDKKLIALFFQTEGYRNIIRLLAKGVNINNIKNEYIQNIPFPLPPLPEQRRIVERIESLFAKLDRAKELAQSTLDSFETRKAAILHKAFKGELTAKWREENGVELENWENNSLSDCCEKIFDGPFGSHLKTDDYVNSGVRVVRLENLKNLWFDDSKLSYVTHEKYKSIEKHTVYPSDIIMSTFIADETKVCQMPEYIGFAVNKADCIVIRPMKKHSTKYLLYFLSSKTVYSHLANQIHGSTRPRVNSSQIKATPIPLPTLPEQIEIVRILDSLLEKEQHAHELCDVIEKINLMKKAILARAFRGELGTNDPSEESAAGHGSGFR